MRGVILALALSAGVFAAGSAQAAVFVTGAAGTLCNGGACTVIAPHPVWGDVDGAGGAVWVGLTNPANAAQNTGYGGGYIAPNVASRTIGAETMLVTTAFAGVAGGSLDLSILADDTATVVLEGPGAFGSQTLFTAFAGQIDPCAPGGTGVAIGCVIADIGTKTVVLTVTGNYTLKVYVFQTNHDVFGVNYRAAVNAPEATTWAMMIAAFGALGWARRRRLALTRA